jgi:nicotianamine synthase
MIVHNIDNDRTAILQSSTLSRLLGYNDRLTFQVAEASHCGSLKSFDVVCLAALVGMDAEEKKEILRSLSGRMRKGSLLCVRSAVGLRSLLYPVSLHQMSL